MPSPIRSCDLTLGDTIKGMVGLDPTGHADPDMKAVLDALKSLNPKPVEKCTAAEARKQPTPADAVKKLMMEPAFSARPSLELEFFGMAAVVEAARDAQAFVSLAQRQAFGAAPL